MSIGTLPLLIPAVIAVSAIAAPALAAETPPPFSGFIKDWVIIGPFQNPERSGPDDRGAFDTDYLSPIGGEAKARIRPETTLATPGGDTVSAKSVRLSGNTLDFALHYPFTDHKLAYAYAELNAPADQEAVFFLGSDDGVKVFVNGKNVFETLLFPGRGYVARQDRFNVRLRKGTNTILAKVENATGAWVLGMEAFTGKEAEDITLALKKAEDNRDFQNQEVVPATMWPGYAFSAEEGRFPRIVWRDVDHVRELAGDVPLTVRWFDKDLNEVKAPKAPGRYGAYIEGKTKDGMVVKRAMTFCGVSAASLFGAEWGLDVPYLGSPIDPKVWDEQRINVANAAGGIFRESFLSSQAGAGVLAALIDAKPTGSPAGVLDGPDVKYDDYHLALRLKLEKRADKVRPLAPPKTVSGSPAEVLHAGTPAEAGVKADAKERIDAVCRKWAEDSGEPFTILVARHGAIITHQAFGKSADGTPLPLDYRHDVASITKAVSGMLFSQFVDQGFTAIDDPIGKYLPGFPTKGKKALTFRHLFTHTSGLAGHGEWGGIHNPYLDNVVLNGLDSLDPGAAHNYNGMGYDLAGKAMEAMTGKSIIRLFHDNLYRPLGIGDVPMADLAYGARLTAYQLGALGQVLANHGRYGDKQFVSEETFAQMLPRSLKEFYPEVDVEWGIGLTWFRETKPGAPTNSTDPKDMILGNRVIGHGSATACILRVDLDHELVIAQIRATAGPKYDEYLKQFLTSVADSLT
ncbi:MAG TPA: serine hydrolase domain-containing protein [Armatimonadota bacterium]|jgi:CubicO group peptidase (beta-lactamase class C family)